MIGAELQRRSLADHVADAIVELVAARGLGGGDTLPTVTDLAETLHVSRSVVREARERLVVGAVVGQVDSRQWRLLGPGLRKWRKAAGASAGDTANADDGVGHRSLADRVADAVLEMILTRKLRAGDPLPPSRQLADDYGVSALVVREALANLAARGVLSRRQGREPEVAMPPSGIVSSILRVRAHLEELGFEELQQCRAGLEIQAAALAASVGTRSDRKAALAPPLAGMRDAVDAESFNTNDVAFHVALSRLSGNRAIHVMLEAFDDLVREAVEASYRRDYALHAHESLAITLAVHDRIAAAVVAGDGAKAAQCMAEHFELSGVEVFR